MGANKCVRLSILKMAGSMQCNTPSILITQLVLHYSATLNYIKWVKEREKKNMHETFQANHHQSWSTDRETISLRWQNFNIIHLPITRFNLIATDSVIEKCFKPWLHAHKARVRALKTAAPTIQ